MGRCRRLCPYAQKSIRVQIFLRYTELACITLALFKLFHSSAAGTSAECLHSYSVYAVSVPILLSAVRRSCHSATRLGATKNGQHHVPDYIVAAVG